MTDGWRGVKTNDKSSKNYHENFIANTSHCIYCLAYNVLLSDCLYVKRFKSVN
jgi:hypothetical protein